MRQIEQRGEVIKKEAIVPVNQGAFAFTEENYRRFYYYKRPNDMQLMARLGYICQGEWQQIHLLSNRDTSAYKTGSMFDLGDLGDQSQEKIADAYPTEERKLPYRIKLSIVSGSPAK